MTGNATSLLPTVKHILVEFLTVQPDLRDANGDDVEVKYSRPISRNREAICLGPAQITQSPGPMRADRKVRDESASFAAYINASKPGQEGEDAELRAFEILAVLENLLADDPTLGHRLDELGVTNGLTVADILAGDPDPNIEGWEGLIRVTLVYTARLD